MHKHTNTQKGTMGRHLLTKGDKNSRDSVTQQSVDKTFPQIPNELSDSIAGVTQSDTDSRQKYVNESKHDTRIANDAAQKTIIPQIYDPIQILDMMPIQLHLQH